MADRDPSGLVRAWLEESVLGRDGRIPAERVLASELGLSRAELRKALAILEREGRLVRQVGRGTFLRPGPDGGSAPDSTSAGDGSPASLSARLSPRDLVQARLTLEPELAALAALNATGAALEAIRAAEGRVVRAETWSSYRSADAAYHRIIAAAAGNGLLLALAETIASVWKDFAWGRLVEPGRRPAVGAETHREHAAVTAAIAARDAPGAAEALRHHLEVEAAATLGRLI